MKKKNFKSLRLNKKSISVLQFTGHIVGGTANADCTHGTCPSRNPRRCFDDSPDLPSIGCPSIVDENGCLSENGCFTGPDETMTCIHYSCGC